MPMSRHDAELFYDRAIPAGAVDDRIPSQFEAQANAVRVGRITLKPEVIRARMAQVARDYILTGTLTESDLERAGFTATQIRDHKAAALALALGGLPGIDAVERAA